MGRNLTNLPISASFQYLTQISGSELTDGLGADIDSLNITASYATNAGAADTATSASHAIIADSALSALTATSASHAVNSDTAISASFATTASFALNVTPINTGSFYVSSSINDAEITFTQGDGSTEVVVVNNVSSSISASHAIIADSALAANTATSASHAIIADSALTANSATTATSASHAVQADSALAADTATSASHAVIADSALSANTATSASHAVIADSALSANTATSASHALIADNLVSDANININSITASAIEANSATFTSASIGFLQTITGSATIIGDSYIILNTSDATRYAGIAVEDSGSATPQNYTASLNFDSLTNDWFYEYTSSADPDNFGVVMFGPEYGTKGSPTYNTANTLVKANGGHHLLDSSITDDGTNVTVTANISASGLISASTYYGDGSNLTGISSDPFPYTGSAGVSGSVVVNGLLQSGNSNNSATGTNTAVIGGNNNAADGDKSVVIGGQNNIANNTCYVFGGENHLANGANSTVVGGTDNDISNGSIDSIFGGWGNDIFGGGTFNQTIVAGNNNVIQGAGGVTRNVLSLGGQFNEMRGNLSNSVIIGGLRNDMGAPSGNNGLSRYSTIIGGQSNKMGEGTTTAGYNTDNCSIINNTGSIIDSGSFQAMFNGALNIISGSTMATIIGSQNSKISGYSNSVIIGGDGIIADADDTVFVPNLTANGNVIGIGNAVFGASTNSNTGTDSVALGGSNNSVASTNTFIVGGTGNSVSGNNHGGVIGGQNNTSNAKNGGVFLGRNNLAQGEGAAVIGGLGNTASNFGSVVIGGQSLSTSKNDEVVVNHLSIYGDTFISSSVLGTGSLIDNLGQQAIVTGSQVQHIVNLSQTEYDALTPDANTLYVIDGTETLGDTVISGSFEVSGSSTFDDVTIDGSSVFSGSVIGEITALSITSNTASMDCSLGNMYTLVINQQTDVHLDVTNIQAGQTINLEVTHDATNSGSLSYAPEFQFPGGTAPTITAAASSKDVLTFIAFRDTTLLGTSLLNFS